MKDLEPPKLEPRLPAQTPWRDLAPIVRRHTLISIGVAIAYAPCMIWMTMLIGLDTWLDPDPFRTPLSLHILHISVFGFACVLQLAAALFTTQHFFIARRMAHIYHGRIPCGACQYDLQNMPDEPAPCPECGRVFASLQHARVHYAGPSPKNIFAPTIPARDTRVRLALLACLPIAIAIDLCRAHRIDWTISLAELTVIWIAPLALVTLALYECHTARRTQQFETLSVTPCLSCAFPLPPADPAWCPRCKHTTTHAEARAAWRASHPKRWWRQQLKPPAAR